MPNGHNGYLDVKAELGYVGYAIFLAFIFSTLHAIGRVADRDMTRAWLLLTLTLQIIITNGLESWVNESGEAMGRFVGAFIDGKTNSYQDILRASQFTYFSYDWGMDALRVVDSELDNKYSPKKLAITLK